MKLSRFGKKLTVGAAVSRLEAPAAAPAGNPSCCSASRERVAKLPVAGGDVEALGGPGRQHCKELLKNIIANVHLLKLAGMLVGGACFFLTISL